VGTFRSFRSPAFAEYLAGQTLSLAGTWAQQVAVAWLAFQLTHSSAVVAMTVALVQLPTLLLAPVAGVLSDRISSRNLLIGTQVASALQAGLLAALLTTGRLDVSAMLSLCGVAGAIGALDAPARQALVPRLVDAPAGVRNAVALSAASIHVARLTGPAVAALILARGGASGCAVFNALSSLAFCAILSRVPRSKTEAPRRIGFGSIREAWHYLANVPAVHQTFSWVALTSVLAIPYASLLPGTLSEWSRPSSLPYAQLMAASGAGAVVAALVLATTTDADALRRVVPHALLAAAMALTVLGLVGGRLPLGLLLLLVLATGFALTLVITGSNVLIQHGVPDALRGRVMGLFVTSFNGAAALGALLLGVVADVLGPRTTLASAGGMTALIVLLAAAMSRAHRGARRR